VTQDDVLDALSAARRAYEAATLALGAAESAARAAGAEVPARELTLERLRIVEPDGRLRLVVGNSSLGETVPLRGRDVPHPGRTPAAGLLFVNDEGTECGGLVWSGTGGDASVHLSFDSYEQNDALILTHADEAGARRSAIEFVDRPSWSLVDLVAELAAAADDAERAAISARYADGGNASRMRLAKEADGSVLLALRDSEGRDRVRLVVGADDLPRVELLDAASRVVRSLD